MAIVIEATYEDGVLKPATPLPFDEHEQVRVIVDNAISRVRQSYGLLKNSLDSSDLHRVAVEPEFSVEESK